jgi:hypothetical protein
MFRKLNIFWRYSITGGRSYWWKWQYENDDDDDDDDDDDNNGNNKNKRPSSFCDDMKLLYRSQQDMQKIKYYIETPSELYSTVLYKTFITS